MLLTVPPNRRLKLRRFRPHPREDRAILLACIGIALIFWLLVKMSQSYTTTKEVVFSFQIAEEEALVKAPPKAIEVELEGTGWDLMFEQFRSPEIRLEYDLVNYPNTALDRSRLIQDIKKAIQRSGIQVVGVESNGIPLQMEERIARQVPVVLQADLQFAPEHHLREPIAITPDSVQVNGPVSLVDPIEFWLTDSLLLSDLKTNVRQRIPLAEPPAEISLSRQSVEVEVLVEPYTEKTLFVPIQVLNAADSVRIFPRQLRITAVLGLSRYDSLTTDAIELAIDLADVQPDTTRSSAPIQVVRSPDFVQHLSFRPKVAEYYFLQPGENGGAPQ